MERVPSADTVLPFNRVRTIMKSSEDTGIITNDVLFAMTRSAELFVRTLATEAFKLSKNGAIKYDHLAQLVNEQTHLEFLLQIIPEKISVREFKEMIQNNSDSDDSDDDTSEDSVSD